MKIQINLYSHFFLVYYRDNSTIKNYCLTFLKEYVLWSTEYRNGRYIGVPSKTFAASNKAATEVRIHINCLTKFIDYLHEKGVTKEDIEVLNHPVDYLVDPTVVHDLKDGWVPREIQIPAIQYIKEASTQPNKLVPLQTGTGKSFISMMVARDLGLRVLYLIRPQFIDKWELDIKKTFNVTDDDIATIRGTPQLMHLLNTFEDAKDTSSLPKYILMSNRTYQNYLKEYERIGLNMLDEGYACIPDKLYEFLGVGIRYIDEVHLDFHLCFKADMYTNVLHSASFSASLIDGNPFITRMYNVAYPLTSRYTAPPPKKYIEAKGVIYRLRPNITPRTTHHGRRDYNHGVYEQYILRNKVFKENYFKMIKEILDNEYFDGYKDGDRCLLFCYSVDMATELTEYLSKTYPKNSVERYVQDDGYENVMLPDIRVSTVLSAGTGIDIPKLKVAILTTAIASAKSNIQSIGRLRELVDDDRKPTFIWLTCQDIDKHMQYHEAKVELFTPLTISVGTRYYESLV